MDILNLLRADGSLTTNKSLAHEIGLHEALIYGELVSLYMYWSKQDRLTDGEWFFCTIDNLWENTTLKKDQQSRAITQLTKLGLIETKRMGLPARRYFRLTNEIYNFLGIKLSENAKSDNDGGSDDNETSESGSNPHHSQFSKNPQTGNRESRKLDVAKPDTNNTRTNNTRINNTKLSNQSINERIALLDLPDEIKTTLNQYQKRLIDDDISLMDIESNYKAHRELLTVGEYQSALNFVLAKFERPIASIEAAMRTAVTKKLELREKAHQSNQPKQDTMPKWFKEDQETAAINADELTPIEDQDDSNLGEEQARFQRMLEQRRERQQDNSSL